MPLLKKACVVISVILLATLLIFGLGSIVPRTPSLDSLHEVVFENEQLKVELVGIINNLSPLFIQDGIVYGMEDHYLFVSEDGGKSFERRGKIPKLDDSLLTKFKDLIARNRFVRNFRKNRMVENISVLPSGTILIVYDQIYRSSDHGMTFESVFEFPADIVQPFPGGLATTPNGEVYFGEYDAISRPNEITILKGENDGLEWRPIYKFPLGEIFHIHSITYDKYRKGLLVATGDLNKESHLYFTNDEFQTIREIGGNSQDWRIVSLISTDEGLYWGSDNDRAGASIFRWNFHENKLDSLRFIGTPSYFSTKLKDGTLVVATAHEPLSLFTKSMKTNPGPVVSLWISRTGSEWFNIISYDSINKLNPEDPSRAYLSLPKGDGSLNALVFTSNYTIKNDFVYHLLKLEWK